MSMSLPVMLVKAMMMVMMLVSGVADPLVGGVTLQAEPEAYPQHCSPETVITTLKGFLAAFNRGDQDQLETYFDHRLRWFWNGGLGGVEPSFRTQDLDSLFNYFAARHEQAEVMRITRVHIMLPANNTISFNYWLHRRAANLGEHGAIHEGKGAIHCNGDHTFVVWNTHVGQPAEPEKSP